MNDVNFYYLYVTCNCANGGQCIDNGICDCSNTGYTGATCTVGNTII